jgi:protein phosphatase
MLCQVSEQHLGVPVMCGSCKRSFSVRSPLAAPAHRQGASLGAITASYPRLDIGAATSAGRVRSHNEDSFVTHHLSWSEQDQQREAALVVVADGLGGHEAGEEASRIVIQTVCAGLLPLLAALPGREADEGTADILGGAIVQAIHAAHQAVVRRAQETGRGRGMGATAAVVVFWEGKALIGHVGDCRVYHRHGSQLTQVTRDQTVAARLVELGQLSPEEAQTHPARNEVYQAIGHQTQVRPERYEVVLAAGGWVLAASDGLHAHLGDSALEEVLAVAPPTAAQMAERLVERANRQGGSDNCTVVAVRGY